MQAGRRETLPGASGPNAKHWGERMLDEGYVHILATDAHGIENRPPLLAEGQRAAEKWVGKEEAHRLVFERPQAILDNTPPEQVAPIPALRAPDPDAKPGGLWRRLVRRRR